MGKCVLKQKQFPIFWAGNSLILPSPGFLLVCSAVKQNVCRSVLYYVFSMVYHLKKRHEMHVSSIVYITWDERISLKNCNGNGMLICINYLWQAAIKPPTFVFFVNDAKLFPETYRRYMEKQLRSSAGYTGTPIRLLWRSRRRVEKDDGECESVYVNSFSLSAIMWFVIMCIFWDGEKFLIHAMNPHGWSRLCLSREALATFCYIWHGRHLLAW